MAATTTKPTRVLTVDQRVELWKLFCEYGHLRSQSENVLADQVQEEYNDLLWSLTRRPTAVEQP